MDKKNKSACCVSHKMEIFGVIFLVIATVLTLYTQSGMGILGLFIAGVVFCKHKHPGCSKCGCTNCECCCDMSSCGNGSCDTDSYNMASCDMPAPKKKASPRKKVKKA
jgi:hypothetical protein